MISFIYGFKNRSVERVRKSLETLRQQTEQGFEVIFVDYGSDLSTAMEVKRLIDSYDFAKYIYSNHRGRPWNRSQCLNIGIREARFDYVFTCDIDIWFPKKFIEQVITLLSPNSIIYPPVHYLPPSVHELSALSLLKKHGEYRGGRGIALIPKKHLTEIGGYDEFYFNWGFEDVDLYERLCSLGLEEIKTADSTVLYHYWHPISHGSLPAYCPSNLEGIFQHYLTQKIGQAKRNSLNWGKRLEDQDRPTVNIVEEKKWDQVNRLFSRDPSKVFVLTEFSNFLSSKSSDELLGIDYAAYPKGYVKLLKFSNALLRRLGIQALAFPVNHVHSFLFELMMQQKIEIQDYYINGDYRNGVTLIK